MSRLASVTVECNLCGRKADIAAESEGDAQQVLEMLGWVTLHEERKDLCPICAGEGDD